MTPAQLFETVEANLLAKAPPDGWSAFRYGARLLAERASLNAAQSAAAAALMNIAFARVETDPADPRRFRLAAGAPGTPAALLRLEGPSLAHPWAADGDDVLALALAPGSKRFWRLTLACRCLTSDPDSHADRLELRQDAWLWVREQALFVLASRDRARLHPATPPRGILVLDPAEVDWTRRGALKGVEQVEILDAPAGGALGCALRRLNPKLGARDGVPLYGEEVRAA